MVLKELIEFGLTENEAKTYLALLELEIAGVQEIAKQGGVNRSSAYVTLESLKKRGLVSISDDKKVRQYIATPPEALLKMAQDIVVKNERILKKIDAAIPEMKALYKGTKKKPLIKVFEGPQGIMNSYIDTLSSKEKIMRVCSSVKNTEKVVPEYIIDYVRQREKIGLRMKGIHPDNAIYKKITDVFPPGFDDPVAIPEKNFKFTADLAIYDNKIGYISNEEEGLSIIIESKEMADVMKSLFDLAFVEAKRLSKVSGSGLHKKSSKTSPKKAQ